VRWHAGIGRLGKATKSAGSSTSEGGSVPTATKMVGTSQALLCPPYKSSSSATARGRLLPLNPLRRPTPHRIAMLGPEESEMPDLLHTRIVRRDADDLRLGRGKSRAQQFHRGPRCPGIIRKADRAQCALVFFEIRKARQLRILELIAGLHHPADPLQKGVLRQVLSKPGPTRHVAEHPGQLRADI